jgi:SAM-dependent methyltransferase
MQLTQITQDLRNEMTDPGGTAGVDRRTYCLFCHGQAKPSMMVREMMYGTRELFQYNECESCGSLQISDIPENLAQHYQHSEYASWRKLPAYVEAPMGMLDAWLRRQRTDSLLTGRNYLGSLLYKKFGLPEFPEQIRWKIFKRSDIGVESRIFDFGCGTGELLKYMRRAGFNNLRGYDKFSGCALQADGIHLSENLPSAAERNFDLVMSHHSFEHLAYPEDGLKELMSFMKWNGKLLIRTPIAQSFAHKKYRQHWAQIDAPRHLTIPSIAGMTALAATCGLKLESVLFDSTDFQFSGSERYQRDIPMFGVDSADGQGALFSSQDIAEFKKRAEELNRAGTGDQACFFLSKDEHGISGKSGASI